MMISSTYKKLYIKALHLKAWWYLSDQQNVTTQAQISFADLYMDTLHKPNLGETPFWIVCEL